MSVDPLPHPRTLAVVHLSNLLRDKPEQEGNILRLLVNKLVRFNSGHLGYLLVLTLALLPRATRNAASPPKPRTTSSKFSNSTPE